MKLSKNIIICKTKIEPHKYAFQSEFLYLSFLSFFFFVLPEVNYRYPNWKGRKNTYVPDLLKSKKELDYLSDLTTYLNL